MTAPRQGTGLSIPSGDGSSPSAVAKLLKPLPDTMIRSLAHASRERLHSALAEGKSEQEAFEEILRVVLEQFRERILS